MKKKILYFKNLKFQKKSLEILKKNFNIISNDKLKKNNFNNIISVLLPMDNFYSKEFFNQFKNLRSIVTPTTGDIHLDTDFLKKKKIKIFNLANKKSKLNHITSTSELTVGHILNLTRKIFNIHKKFIKDKKFEKYNYLLSNKMLTVGIVGLGRIGKHVANRVQALGFNTIYYDPFVDNEKFQKIKNFKQFVKKTNILTIHMHYKKKYLNMFDLKLLKLLKKPSYIINTSRGEFIHETELIKSLKRNIIEGAGLDVLKDEFKKKFRKNPKKNILFNFFIKNKKYNIFITPKQGGSNKSAWRITEELIINQLINYEKNKI